MKNSYVTLFEWQNENPSFQKCFETTVALDEIKSVT